MVSSDFTIQDMISSEFVIVSRFLVLTYICTFIVLLGITLFSALSLLISFIKSIITCFSFSTSSSLFIFSFGQSLTIRESLNHNLLYNSSVINGMYGCHNFNKVFIT